MINNVISNFFTPSTVQHYRIEGKVGFHVEPIETKGRLPFNTCSVTLKAYTGKDKNIQLPIKIKWYRVQAERNYEVEELDNKDFYHFSAMDIGGEIKASIRSMDDNYKGACSIIFGPIKFDDNLRRPLESVLLSGFSKFNVMVHEEDSSHPDKVQPISVFTSPNQVKFFYYTGNDEENFYLEISNERPRLEIVQDEPENLFLYFDEACVENDVPVRRKIYRECEDNKTEQYFIHLRFFSRNSRDIFVTAIRLFRIVPVVTLSNLFRQIDVLLRENRLFEGNNKITLNELLVEYDLLRSNLLNTVEYAKDLDKDREELQECVTVLERDLEHTMLEFKKYIEENVRNGNIGNLTGGSANNKSVVGDGLKRLDDLNSSLLSNRADMKKQIKQKLDESTTNIKEKALKPQVNTGEMAKLQEELQQTKKLNAMYAKKIREMQDSKEKKKETYKAMKAQISNVSREISNIKELNDSMQKDSKIQSQMFDVSGIESKHEEEDMFHSNPFQLEQMKKKPAPKIESSNLYKIEEKDERLSQSTAMELRVKEEEINMLRSRIRDLEQQFMEAQAKEAYIARKPAHGGSVEDSAKAEKLNGELAKARMKESELQVQADKSLKYIEEFRNLIKAVIAEDEPSFKPPMNSSLIDESLMNDVFKVNLNTKLKMIDLENDNLKKRVTTLTKEVYLLREENRNLKTEGGNNDRLSTTNLTGPSKEEFEGLKKQTDNLTTENDNLRMIINRLKTQDDSLNMNGAISALKKELADLAQVNQSLLQQKTDLAKKNEQIRSHQSSELPQQQSQRNEAEERREKLIIEQLTKTNERLMGEINRLEEKVRAYDEARMSFISDVNDSYMSQNLKNSRFK